MAFKKSKASTFLGRYRARCVFCWQVVLILSLFCVVNASALLFLSSNNIDLIFIISGHAVFNADRKYEHIFYIVIVFVLAASSLTSVWLGSWKFTLQSIVTVGLLFVCVGVLVDTILSLVISAIDTDQSTWMIVLVTYVSPTIVVLGYGFVITNMLQLAIEQIPDASTAQLSSLVSWFLFCNCFGSWLNSCTYSVFVYCISRKGENIVILKLFYAALLATFVSIYFLFKHKLLDNSPPTNIARKIYVVLSYAYKHKNPQTRSALTYWEDKPIPRLSLGKSKYGGPFSNEEVEDVRTFVFMSFLIAAVFIYLGFLHFNAFSCAFIEEVSSNDSLYIKTFSDNNLCIKKLTLYFTSTSRLWIGIFVIVYELILVPTLSYRMPNIIRRLVLAGIIAILFSVSVTVMSAIEIYVRTSGVFYLQAMYAGITATFGLIKALFYISTLEFICAQSPYILKNYFIGVAMWAIWTCRLLTGAIFVIHNSFCATNTCYLTYSVVTFCLCAIGLLFFTLSIKYYRKRSRGQEDEHQQIWVEEIYGKYVAAATYSCDDKSLESF